MYSTNPPQKLNLKASKNISFTKTLARTNKICSFQQDITVYLPFTQLPTSTSPPSRTAPKQQHQPTEIPLASAKEPFGLQKLCQIVDGAEGVSDARGPADLLDPVRALRWSSSACRVGCGWMTAGWRPMPWRDGPCAVIRNW